MSKKEYVGIKRAVDKLGRIVIPKEIRDELDIDYGDILEISMVCLNKKEIVIELKKTAAIIQGEIKNEN